MKIPLSFSPFLEAAALLPRLFPFCGSLATPEVPVTGTPGRPPWFGAPWAPPGFGVAEFGDHIHHNGSCRAYATLEISGNRLTGESLGSLAYGRKEKRRHEMFRFAVVGWTFFCFFVSASQRGSCWLERSCQVGMVWS